MEAVARDGFSRNYAGVRVSKSGRRFRIKDAVVWNLFEDLPLAEPLAGDAGSPRALPVRLPKGQACLFFRRDVEFLDQG